MNIGVVMANIFQKMFINKKAIQEKTIYEQFIWKYGKFLKKDCFLSKKMVKVFLEEYQEKFDDLALIIQKDLIKEFASKEKINHLVLQNAWDQYKGMDKQVAVHNEVWLQSKLQTERKYLDLVLQDDDPAILLDEEQRRVVLNDEDYCLIIAGAGAGKTTTIVAKVKYLVDKKKVDPQKILVVSFTNKAVNELKERVNTKLKISCPIATFHSCGNAIIHKTQEQKINVMSEGGLYSIVKEYVGKNIYYDKEDLKNLILLFGYYIDMPYNCKSIEELFTYQSRSDFSTLKSNVGDINQAMMDSRRKEKRTIRNEVVKSFEEVQIANFLYLNGIEYEYEKKYPYNIPGSSKHYTPDFYITQNGKEWYLEHFGISEDGKHNRYSELELIKYKGSIADKQLTHLKYQTKLLMTYSTYLDGASLLDHLQEVLKQAGIMFQPKSEEEVYEKLTKIENNKYFDKLIFLITRFISNFKVNNYTIEDFTKMKNTSNNVRTKLFLDICEKAYLDYQRRLIETKRVDFEDMINESTRLLREVKDLNQKLDFEYIIVDEYQDISKQRFNLTKELADVTDAKIIAVGDDWQSIYAFAGSQIELFTKFQSEMGYADILYITHTYRNSQELIDIAGHFVQENPSQLRKKLISNKSIVKPVVVFTYSDDFSKNKVKGIKGINEEKAKQLENIIDCILAVESKKTSILIIGRYGFDGSQLGQTPYFTYNVKTKRLRSNKNPDANITFLTAHSSKGLTYDNVIIINAVNAIYGFPSQIEDDPVLNLVVHQDRNYNFAEERRLFYVAMTRTRNRTFILAPQLRPSSFVLELLTYDNVVVHGVINKDIVSVKKTYNKCPVCGYPLQIRDNKTYGLKLFMCTNDPEI